MAAALESALPIASVASSTSPQRQHPPPLPIPIQIPPAGAAEPSNSLERPPISPITPVAAFAQLASTPALPSSASATNRTTMSASNTQIPHSSTAAPPPTPSNPATMMPPQSYNTAVPSSSDPQQTPRIFSQPPPTAPTQPSAPLSTAPKQPPEPKYMTHPLPVTVPEEDNADAQALRAALAVLQIQRDKSTRDIKTLTTLKEAAAKDPEHFVSEMLAGHLGHRTQADDPLAPTLESDHSSAEDDDDEDDDEHEHTQTEGESASTKLPKFPTRQNIVRCPPVNWAKYHVLGDSLDKLHEEQRRRPTLGEPTMGDWAGRDHVIAAPYSPWQDPLQLHPMQTRKGSKKPLG